MDFGESLEEAVKREIKEETGLDIEIVKLIGHHEAIFTHLNYHSVIFFFLAKPKGERVVLESKVMDGQFFSREELKDLNLVSSAKWLFEHL